MYSNCIYVLLESCLAKCQNQNQSCSITQRDNLVNQSKLEANTFRQPKALENMCKYATIYFGFTPDWLTKWHKISKPIG